jgi:hypothetical protein
MFQSFISAVRNSIHPIINLKLLTHKGKDKIILRLINLASRHEDVWGRESIAPPWRSASRSSCLILWVKESAILIG